jgi:hypothetical protein
VHRIMSDLVQPMIELTNRWAERRRKTLVKSIIWVLIGGLYFLLQLDSYVFSSRHSFVNLV